MTIKGKSSIIADFQVRLAGRIRLRSSSTLKLFVPSYRLTTTGNRLEHFTCPCPVITIYRNLSPAFKDILVSVISQHSLLTDITNYVTVDFEMAVAILAT